MITEKSEFIDKKGHKLIIRSCKKEDAKGLIEYLNITSKETRFLLREESETHLSIENEERFIKGIIEDERRLMLVCEYEEKIIGTASFDPISSLLRLKHRASIGIALYKEFNGLGIGSEMMKILLQEAQKAGYLQCELEVVTTNKAAIALYQKMGFKEYGILKDSIRYSDGTFADCCWMMKKL